MKLKKNGTLLPIFISLARLAFNSVPPYLNSNSEIQILTESLWEKMSNYFCILYIECHLIQFLTQRWIFSNTSNIHLIGILSSTSNLTCSITPPHKLTNPHKYLGTIFKSIRLPYIKFSFLHHLKCSNQQILLIFTWNQFSEILKYFLQDKLVPFLSLSAILKHWTRLKGQVSCNYKFHLNILY